jgi:hypothetical protein
MISLVVEMAGKQVQSGSQGKVQRGEDQKSFPEREKKKKKGRRKRAFSVVAPCSRRSHDS